MIYEVHQYMDNEGRQVIRQKPIDEGDEAFIGVFPIPIPTEAGMQEAQLQIDFPKEYDIKKCFEDFETLAEKEYNRIIKEYENTIITPKEAGGIIIP